MNKKLLNTIIFKTDTRLGRIFDEILLVLIFLSVVIVMLNSVEHINDTYGKILYRAQSTIMTLFTIEYILRIWVSENTRGYIFSFFGVVDLLAILPSFFGVFVNGQSLMMLRSLRLLRLFRVFKLGQHVSASTLLRNSLVASSAKIVVFILSVFIVVMIVGTFMYLIEGPVAGFVNIPTGVYRAIVTITTVGYGDITPLTPIGKLVSASLMILGYGIIAVPTGLVTAHLVHEKAKRDLKLEKKRLKKSGVKNKKPIIKNSVIKKT